MRGILDSFVNGFTPHHFALRDPLAHLFRERWGSIGVVGDDEALPEEPLGHDLTEDVGLLGPGGGSVALYVEMLPQAMILPRSFIPHNAASRCSPPTLSK